MKIENCKFNIENFSSNSIRLSGREWIAVAMLIMAVVFFWPAIWQHLEQFQPEKNYRLPYTLSSDYWLYERYAQVISEGERTMEDRKIDPHPSSIVLIGDSVIWGHYVSRDNTLSAKLNDISGNDRFMNFGLDGVHPAAMDGLLRYYAKDITGRKIILHLNPLWFSSPKHDLQTDKEFTFNHPQLVPQFRPAIACYNASLSSRLSAVLRRYIPILNWREHINLIFDISNLQLQKTEPNIQLPNQTNNERRASAGGEQWVELQTSVQWRFFLRTIAMLKQRNNKIFVVVGPYNEHRLDGESLTAYEKLKSDIESWLTQNKIDCYFPPALPAELYIDASHPSAEGYAVFAQRLIENDSLKKYLLYN
jgi:hypothetical protein